MVTTYNPLQRSESDPGRTEGSSRDNSRPQSFSAQPTHGLWQRMTGQIRAKKKPGSRSSSPVPFKGKPIAAAEEKRKSLEDDVYLGDAYTHAFSPGRSPWNESLFASVQPKKNDNDFSSRTSGEFHLNDGEVKSHEEILDYLKSLPENSSENVKLYSEVVDFLHTESGILGATQGAGVFFKSLNDPFLPNANQSAVDGRVRYIVKPYGEALHITSSVKISLPTHIHADVDIPQEFRNFINNLIGDKGRCKLLEDFLDEPLSAAHTYLYQKNQDQGYACYEWERRLSDAVFRQSPFLAYHRLVLALSDGRNNSYAGEILLKESLTYDIVTKESTAPISVREGKIVLCEDEDFLVAIWQTSEGTQSRKVLKSKLSHSMQEDFHKTRNGNTMTRQAEEVMRISAAFQIPQKSSLTACWVGFAAENSKLIKKLDLEPFPQLQNLITKLKDNLCVSTDREDIELVAEIFGCSKESSIESVPFLHLPSLRDAYKKNINDENVADFLGKDVWGIGGSKPYQGIHHEGYTGHVAFESSRITMTLLMAAFCPGLVQTILADFDLRRQHLEIMLHCLSRPYSEYSLWTLKENLLGLIETLERHVTLELPQEQQTDFQALRLQIEKDWDDESEREKLLILFINTCNTIVVQLREDVNRRVRQFKAFCKKAHDEFPMLLWQRVKSLLEDLHLVPALRELANFETQQEIVTFAKMLGNAITHKEYQKEALEVAKDQMRAFNLSVCSKPLSELVGFLKSLIDFPPYRGNFLEPISDAEWRASKGFHPYLRYVIEKILIPYQALVDYMPVIHDLNMRHFFKQVNPCWHESDKQRINKSLNNGKITNADIGNALDALELKEKERVYWALYELRSRYFSDILEKCTEVLFEGIFKDKTPFSETRDCDGKIRDSDDTFGLKLFAIIDECYQCSLYLNNAKKNFTKVMASYLDEIEKNISGGQTSNLYKQVQCLKTFYENHLFDYSGEFSEEQINADGFLSNLIDEANTIHKAAKQSIPSSENVEPYAPLDFFVNTGLAYLKQNATADALFFFRRTLWISAAHYLFQRLQPQISSFSGQMSTAVDRLKILMLNMKSFLFSPYEAELEELKERVIDFEYEELFNRWLSLKAGKFDKYEDGRLLTVTLVCRAVFSGIKGWDDLMGLPWKAPSAWNNCISILTEGLDRVLILKNNERCHVFLPYLLEKIIACVFKIYHISRREPLILGSYEKNWGSFIAKLKELAQCQPVFVPFVNVCSLLSENLFQTKHNFLFCLLSFYKVLHELRQENPCLVEEDTLKKIEAIWSSSVSRRYFLSKDVAAKLSVFFEDLSDAACKNMKGFFKESVQNLVCLGNVLLVFLSTNAKLDVSRQLLCKKLENNQASLPVLLIAWSSKAYHAVEIHRLNKRIFSYECFLDASNLFAQAYQAHILSSCQEKTWQDCCAAMGLDNVALSQHFNIDFFNLTLQLWYQGLMQWRQQSHQQPKVWPKEFLSTVVCGGQQDSFANPIVFRDKAVRAIVAVFQLSYLIRLVLLELCKQDPLNQKVVLHWLYAINWMICDVKHPLESLEKEGVQHTDLIQLVPQELNPPFRAKVQGIFNEWQKVEEDPKSLAESHPRQLAYLGWFKERGNKESFTTVTTVSLGK